jgi:CelD/BcsL family acetyltransferase involved in cellulose biosynthesis
MRMDSNNEILCQHYGMAYEETLSRRVSTAAGRGPRIGLRLHSDIAEIAGLWRDFEETAASTLYQTHAWCSAWLDTIGATAGVEPRIVTGSHADGSLAFILPFQLRRQWGVRRLEWLTAPHANYGYGLFDRGFLAAAPAWFAANWSQVAAAAGPFDVLNLEEMPASLFGARHPMAECFTLQTANHSYAMALEPDYESLHARHRSGDTRRHARKRDAALAKVGKVGFGLPEGADETHRVLSTMFLQQEQRLAESGVRGVFGGIERAFIHRLSEASNGSKPLLLPYYLTCDGEILSVMLGGNHGGIYWALIASLANTPLRRHSPGDSALRHTIEACCARGLAGFDFAAGDADYKSAWADEVIAHHAMCRGRTLAAAPLALAFGAKLWLKRLVKHQPRLRALALGLRRRFWGHAVVRH